MASELSSGCTEVNEVVDDEKEEGELSLDDVSSSEEGQPYKYPQSVFKDRCSYCQSTQVCAIWCKNLTYKISIKRDVSLQGKENRINQHYIKEVEPSSASGISAKSSLHNQQHKKTDNDENSLGPCDGLVPISSDSDMDLVGLSQESPKKKTSRRTRDANGLKKPSRSRRRHRKKSPSLSLSLSPPSLDIALLVKESIHKIDSKKESSRSRTSTRHRSSERRKSPRKHSHSPVSNRLRALPKKKPRSPLPLRKSPVLRSRKPSSSLKKSPTSVLDTGDEQVMPESPSSRGNVTKLLKKVRQLEPFSSKAKEKGSSLKDKLSSIIKLDKKESTSEKNEKSEDKKIQEQSAETDVIKDVVSKDNNVNEENEKKESAKEPLVEEDDQVLLCHVTSERKHINDIVSSPKDMGIEPVNVVKPKRPSVSPLLPSSPPPSSPTPSLLPVSPIPSPTRKLPNFCMDDNEEDLELRLIALRSAVIKKHQTRMKSGGGIKKKKKKEEPLKTLPVPRLESPIAPTFLEEISQLAELCSPTSPLSLNNDIYCPEDMELDSDLELDKTMSEVDNKTSPYSPTDELSDNILFENPLNSVIPSTPKQTVNNLSLYSPSNPTETPIFKPFLSSIAARQNFLANEARTNLDASVDSIMTGQESRPYSPSDDTVYDPELPGVHSTDQLGKGKISAPLQPPPLPPLSMLTADDSLMLSCSNNLLNTFVKPMPLIPPPLPPPSLLNSCPPSPVVHRSLVNPLLLPTPLFAYAAKSATSASTSVTDLNAPVCSVSAPVCSMNAPVNSISPPICSISAPLSNINVPTPVMLPVRNVNIPPTSCVTSLMTSSVSSQANRINVDSINMAVAASASNTIDDFGETDLDGSPLVSIEKPNPHTTWPYFGESLYQRDAPNVVPTNVNSIQLNKQNLFLPHSEVIQDSFKPVEPVDSSSLTNPFFKPIKIQPVPRKNAPLQTATGFNTSFEDEREEFEPLATRLVHTRTWPRIEETLREDKQMENQSFPTPELRKSKRKRSKHASERSLKEIKRKEMTPLREIRKRSRSVRRSVERSLKSSKDVKDYNKTESKDKSEDTKKNSISNDILEDDEDTLRELLLASLGKRKKPVVSLKPSENKTVLKKSDEISSETNLTNSQVEVPGIVASSCTNAIAKDGSHLLATHLSGNIDQSNKTIASEFTSLSSIETSTVTATTTVTTSTELAITDSLLMNKSEESDSLCKISQKKISTIPMSTKVVNNAKRYQNLMAQRKMLQQKLIAASKSRFKLNNAQLLQSSSPLTGQSPAEVKKFIISLNEDTESESENEEHKTKSRPALAIPISDFEKSVDQFLKNVRQQHEAGVKTTSTEESSPSKSDEDDSPQDSLIDPNAEKNTMISSISANVTVDTNITNTVDTVTTAATVVPTITTVTDTTNSTIVTDCISTAPISMTTTVVTTVSSTTLITTSTATITTATTSATAIAVSSLKNSQIAVPLSKTVPTKITPLNLITTPQAVKHLPASQQEEYRRLKQQIIERERLKMQKSKEAKEIATTNSTANTSQTIFSKTNSVEIPTTDTLSVIPTTDTLSVIPTTNTLSVISKTPVNLETTSVSDSLPVLASDLPSETSEIVKAPIETEVTAASIPSPTSLVQVSNASIECVSSPSVSNNSPLITESSLMPNEMTSSTQSESSTPVSEPQENNPTLVAQENTQISVPQENSNKELTPLPIVKSVNSTSRVSQDKINRNKTAATTSNSIDKKKSMPISKTIIKTSKAGPLSKRRPNIHNLSEQQVALLDKMNNALNNQKKQISAVAHKVSSLKILTKDQINSSIQQKNFNSEASVNLKESSKTMVTVEVHNTVLDKNTLDKSKNFSNTVADKPASQNQNKESLPAKASNVDKSKNSNSKKLVNNKNQPSPNLHMEKQKQLLAETEKKLIDKRQVVVDDITEMSENLCQWETEKNVQNNLTIEIKKLREQLKIAEKKLQEQNGKLKEIHPRILQSHKKINEGRKECFRLTKICNDIGQQITGSNYIVPTAGAELLNTKLKDVANHSQKLKNKKTQPNQSVEININKTKNKSDTNNSNSTQNNSTNKQQNINDKILDNYNLSEEQSGKTNKSNINLNLSSTAGINSNNQLSTVQNPFDNAVNNIINSNIINTVSNSKNNSSNEKTNKSSNKILTKKSNLKSKSTNQNITLQTENINENVAEKTVANSNPVDIISNQNITHINNKNSLTDNNVTDIAETQSSEQTEINSQLIDFNTENSNGNDKNERIINNLILQSTPENQNLNVKDNNQNNSKNLSVVNKNSSTSVPKIRVKSLEVLLKPRFINSLQRNRLLNQNEQYSANNSLTNNIGNKLVRKIDSIDTNVAEKQLDLQRNAIVNDKNIVEENNRTTESQKTFTDIFDKNIHLTENCANNSKKSSELKSRMSRQRVIAKPATNVSVEKGDSVIDVSSNNVNSTFSKEISLVHVSASDVVDDTSEPPKKRKRYKRVSKKVMGSEELPQTQENVKKKAAQPYESILKHLQGSRNNIKDGVLCPYELSGTCNDEDCQYIHMTTSHCR